MLSNVQPVATCIMVLMSSSFLIMMRVKNHHIPATIRVDTDLEQKYYRTKLRTFRGFLFLFCGFKKEGLFEVLHNIHKRVHSEIM